MSSVKRPKWGKHNIFRALQAADILCEAPELWKIHALDAADMLCEAPELWTTHYISCFGNCRYAL
jgi:hypothetical protein